MILVDSSIWIDHLRYEIAEVSHLATSKQILIHPFVIGEIAVGNLKNRSEVLRGLHDMPAAMVVSDADALDFIERFLLAGRGLSYIDIHLLAAARLNEATLWTADRRLQKSAELLSLSITP